MASLFKSLTKICHLLSMSGSPATVSKLSCADPKLLLTRISQVNLPATQYTPASYCRTWTEKEKPRPRNNNTLPKPRSSDLYSRVRIGGDGPDKYEPRSPYQQSTPRTYGYYENQHLGGLLPRIKGKITKAPKYRRKNLWDRKHALFGQNDYIDILGDGDIHPVDLVKGPKWLRGFNGNELERLVRRLKMSGGKLKNFQPMKHEKLNKRVRYLYRRYNYQRSH